MSGTKNAPFRPSKVPTGPNFRSSAPVSADPSSAVADMVESAAEEAACSAAIPDGNAADAADDAAAADDDNKGEDDGDDDNNDDGDDLSAPQRCNAQRSDAQRNFFHIAVHTPFFTASSL